LSLRMLHAEFCPPALLQEVKGTVLQHLISFSRYRSSTAPLTLLHHRCSSAAPAFLQDATGTVLQHYTSSGSHRYSSAPPVSYQEATGAVLHHLHFFRRSQVELCTTFFPSGGQSSVQPYSFRRSEEQFCTT
jgi:hypothetical protein